ncbi:hypothetical protein JOC47_002515 [Halanaerobacter jeridensis]|uniref:Uncharacterized protein n=1 Tax=Halanaerobacter jeridensis TaxID=706427 RepID=A0A939BRT1_9FIRM|nr:hypothetical protein [Halanaerobacter jeridensis]
MIIKIRKVEVPKMRDREVRRKYLGREIGGHNG